MNHTKKRSTNLKKMASTAVLKSAFYREKKVLGINDFRGLD